jgi:hypothetical protein
MNRTEKEIASDLRIAAGMTNDAAGANTTAGSLMIEAAETLESFGPLDLEAVEALAPYQSSDWGQHQATFRLVKYCRSLEAKLRAKG